MTPQQANLAPCPFCNAAARIESNRDWHTLIADHDEDCVFIDEAILVMPAQDGPLAEMIEDWNRRAPAPTEPAVDRDAILEEAAALFDQPHMEYFGCNIQEDIRALKLATPASPAVPARDHLLKIIAFAYQIAGWHDAPEHILAVLAHPESATAAQVDAMLPYQVGGGQAVPGERSTWKLMPPDATEAMMHAAQDVPSPRPYGAVYRAMFSVAPAVPGDRTQAQIDLAYAALSQVPIGAPQVAQPSGNTGELPQVAQASQPTSAEGMTAWAAYCPAGFQFIHADQRVVEDFVYTRRYCGEGPYSIMHMKVSRPTSAEGKDSEQGATRQYYYKTNACTARSPISLNCPYSPDCTCWHDEGAGPLAHEPGSIREWRATPQAPT